MNKEMVNKLPTNCKQIKLEIMNIEEEKKNGI